MSSALLCETSVLASIVSSHIHCLKLFCFFFFQAEDGIRDLVRSRGLGDVYKRQGQDLEATAQARKYTLPYPPSSPAIALFKDGKLVHLSLIHI